MPFTAHAFPLAAAAYAARQAGRCLARAEHGSEANRRSWRQGAANCRAACKAAMKPGGSGSEVDS